MVISVGRTVRRFEVFTDASNNWPWIVAEAAKGCNSLTLGDVRAAPLRPYMAGTSYLRVHATDLLQSCEDRTFADSSMRLRK